MNGACDRDSLLLALQLVGVHASPKGVAGLLASPLTYVVSSSARSEEKTDE